MQHKLPTEGFYLNKIKPELTFDAIASHINYEYLFDDLYRWFKQPDIATNSVIKILNDLSKMPDVYLVRLLHRTFFSSNKDHHQNTLGHLLLSLNITVQETYIDLLLKLIKNYSIITEDALNMRNANNSNQLDLIKKSHCTNKQGLLNLILTETKTKQSSLNRLNINACVNVSPPKYNVKFFSNNPQNKKTESPAANPADKSLVHTSSKYQNSLFTLSHQKKKSKSKKKHKIKNKEKIKKMCKK